MGCCALVRPQTWKSRTLGHDSSQLEAFTNCPVCGISFTPNDTQRQLSAHIVHCSHLQPLLKSLSVQVSPNATMHNRRESLAPLSYTEKAQHFRLKCGEVRIPWYKASHALLVRRDSLVSDSLSHLQNIADEELRKEFEVLFSGECGVDVGGLMKEWLHCLSCELFRKETGLFVLAATDAVRYRVNPQSADLPLYTLVGKVLGKALFDGVPLSCPLTAPLYRQLGSGKVRLRDLRDADRSLFDSLSYIKSCNISEMTVSTFVVTAVDGTPVELKTGGKDENITEANKREYVRLRKQWETVGSVQKQLEALLRGFHAVVPAEWVAYFEPEELELLMCGQPVIDVKDWERHTEYRGDFHARHPVVLWFWAVLRTLSQLELSQFLFFSIGSARPPMEGFSALTNTRGDYVRFTLQSVDFDPKAPYPRAHTCFHRVDLPVYNSKSELRTHMLSAISNSLGFGLE